MFVAVNKHKPWIETTYHGIVTENDDKVLLDPPLIALDKDAPLRYAGERETAECCCYSVHVTLNENGSTLINYPVRMKLCACVTRDGRR